ncbi:MAG: hypothetical protein Q7T82_16305 [Armatimonadota bacterium]|nr:hypothetical protein [Armatimonadota bacterium]
MLRGFLLQAAIGGVVFAFFSPLIWGWYVSAFVMSAIAGGIIGCAGAGIGECMFLLMKLRGGKTILDYAIRGFLVSVATITGPLAGGFLGYISSLVVWTVIDQLHPEAKFPGDIIGPIAAGLGALLALPLSLFHASGAMHYWLDKGERGGDAG